MQTNAQITQRDNRATITRRKTNQQRFAVIPLTIGSVLKGPAEALK
jgi:hypothetical protein